MEIEGAIEQGAAIPVPVTHKNILIIYGGLVLVMLLAALDGTIVSTALPTIVGELGGLTHLSWVVTAYLLAQTVVTPLYGKLGDIYGRKTVLQVGIVIFLLGSALCGFSQTLTQLIIFRVIQGLGGGGLMVTTQAVIGDVVAPRDRGRYQGIFGAVFGVASVAGPMLGGYFTAHLSWRWIFYINLPFGIIALLVLAAILPSRADYVKRSIDYFGALLLATFLSAVVLISDLGGTSYPWLSPFIIGAAIISVVSLVAFLLVERRVDEPVLPLDLFKNPAFVVSTSVSLIVGFALFGSVTFIPLFLQGVKGLEPTSSGLYMMSMMGGLLVTSIGTGQTISRWGRYKPFPIIGTALMTTGLFLLSRIDTNTEPFTISLMMLVLGFGLGSVMQVLILSVQNSVQYHELGVATSGVTLFRSIGGSLGTAVFGGIFAAMLGVNLTRLLPVDTEQIGTLTVGANAQTLRSLSEDIRGPYLQAFALSLATVFLFAAVIAFIGFIITLFMPEKTLRESIAKSEANVGKELGEALAMPVGTESEVYLLKSLSLLADRDVRRQYLAEIVERSGVDLDTISAWLLIRLERQASLNLNYLSTSRGIEMTRLEFGINDLIERGLIEERPPDDGQIKRWRLTEAGCDVLNKLVAARRENLEDFVKEWSPEQRAEVAGMMHRLAKQLVPEVENKN
jgi:EmrB/QacA subfamily drug resistance transporter